MQDSNNNSFNPYFSHIYLEPGAEDYPVAQQVLKRFPNSVRVPISHYKDVFCRTHQANSIQKKSPALILAVKKEPMVYPGAKVCQDFGNAHFYYASSMMNCYYDCEYCYLQGMYPSGHMVIFVNPEITMAEVDRLLAEHPVYLCISYDTDLLGAERFTGLLHQWAAFTRTRHNLTVEVRTKSADIGVMDDVEPMKNMIFAWTLSPEEVVTQYEHGTPNVTQRLQAAKKAREWGWNIRLCFDPMLYVPDFETAYGALFQQVKETIPGTEVAGVSLGVFRISKTYLKPMRKQRLSPVTAFPFTLSNGVYDYGPTLNNRMLSFALAQLDGYMEEEKIFIWSDDI